MVNRVDNDGNTISDRNDATRNVAVCKALTREYGLHFAVGKMNVNRDRLRGKDKVKYQIYDAVREALSRSDCWTDLCGRLSDQGIETGFRLDRRKGKIIGVTFTKDGISFSGSRVDRSMGFYRIDRQLGGRVIDGVQWREDLYVGNDILPENGAGAVREESIYTPEKPSGQTTGLTCSDSHVAPSDSGTFAGTGSSANVVQIGISVLVELCVQPHQTRVSSGGGGGGNDRARGDNDNEKEKHKPRTRRR